jgi:hypothetical protein
VGHAGVTKMHLRVDDTGQYGEAAAVDGLAGHRPRQIAGGSDPAAGNGKVAHRRAVVVDDGGSLEHEVIALGHSNLPLL